MVPQPNVDKVCDDMVIQFICTLNRINDEVYWYLNRREHARFTPSTVPFQSSLIRQMDVEITEFLSIVGTRGLYDAMTILSTNTSLLRMNNITNVACGGERIKSNEVDLTFLSKCKL